MDPKGPAARERRVGRHAPQALRPHGETTSMDRWPWPGSTCVSSRCPTTALGPGAHGPRVGQKWKLEEDASSPLHRTTGSGKKGRGDPGIGLPGTQPSAGQPACPRMKERPRSPGPASRVHLCPFRLGNPSFEPHHPCPLCPAPRWQAGEAQPCALTPRQARVLGGAPGRDAADTLLHGHTGLVDVPQGHGRERQPSVRRRCGSVESAHTVQCPRRAPPSTERGAGPAHAPTWTGPGGPGARPAQWEKPHATGRGTQVHSPAACLEQGATRGVGVPS